MATSVSGRAHTTRPARYLKQLCSHLGKKLEVSDRDDLSTIAYADAVARLHITGDTIEWAIAGPDAQDVHRLMGIVEGHLVRFGDSDGLTTEWDDATVEEDYRDTLRSSM